MTHHVYTTKGVVLRQQNVRESDRLAAILTRDLGLIYGTARGVRKSNSRLGSALLDLATIKVSLVRGKRVWRITTVSLADDLPILLRGRKEALKALSRVASLITKLVKGEEKHPALYDKFEKATKLILEISDHDLEFWELLTVSEILSELGFFSPKSVPHNINEAKDNRKELVALVNAGLKESLSKL